MERLEETDRTVRKRSFVASSVRARVNVYASVVNTSRSSVTRDYFFRVSIVYYTKTFHFESFKADDSVDLVVSSNFLVALEGFSSLF